MCFNGVMNQTHTAEYRQMVERYSSNFRRLAVEFFQAKYPGPHTWTEADLDDVFEVWTDPVSDQHPLWQIDCPFAVIYDYSLVKDSYCPCVDLEEVESFRTDTINGIPMTVHVIFDLDKGVTL